MSRNKDTHKDPRGGKDGCTQSRVRCGHHQEMEDMWRTSLCHGRHPARAETERVVRRAGDHQVSHPVLVLPVTDSIQILGDRASTPVLRISCASLHSLSYDIAEAGKRGNLSDRFSCDLQALHSSRGIPTALYERCVIRYDPRYLSLSR